MQRMTFYNRDDELEALKTAFESPGHDFHVIYGRLRIGKTELLKEFCRHRPTSIFTPLRKLRNDNERNSSSKLRTTSAIAYRELTGGTRCWST